MGWTGFRLTSLIDIQNQDSNYKWYSDLFYPLTKLSLFSEIKEEAAAFSNLVSSWIQNTFCPAKLDRKATMFTLHYNRKEGCYTAVSHFKVEPSDFYECYENVHTNRVENQDCSVLDTEEV